MTLDSIEAALTATPFPRETATRDETAALCAWLREAVALLEWPPIALALGHDAVMAHLHELERRKAELLAAVKGTVTP